MDRPEPSVSPTRKYIVAPRFGRWGVRRDGEESGVFASQEEAVNFACGQARGGAYTGTLGVVIVQAEVQEMHCFTPRPGALASQAPARLRLVRADP